jgi:hypothetical protein
MKDKKGGGEREDVRQMWTSIASLTSLRVHSSVRRAGASPLSGALVLDAGRRNRGSCRRERLLP